MRLASLLFLLVTACSSSSETTRASSTMDAGAPTPDAAALPVRSEACLTRDEEIQVRLDKVRGKRSADVLLNVVDTVCGESFAASGPTMPDLHRLVRLGSITKTYVAVVILQLVAEGSVALDATLETYLPGIASTFAPVTIRQLLQHTSGIYNYSDAAEWRAAAEAEPKRNWTSEELLAYATGKPLAFTPGSKWSYSNTGYILLGMIAERVEKAPLASVIRTRILAPNQLNETFFEASEPVKGELVPGMDTRDRDITAKYSASMAGAAGAMVASPADAARFIELVGNGTLVPMSVRAEFEKAMPTMAQRGLSYGLGVFMMDATVLKAAGPSLGHGGDIAGYHSWALYFPEKKTTLVAVAAADGISGNDILAATVDVLFP